MPNTQVYNFKPVIQGDSCAGVQAIVRVSSVTNFAGVKISFILYSNSGVVLEQSTDNGGITVLTTEPTCKFQVNEFVCAMKLGRYTYKIKFQYPSGKLRTYLTGSFTVTNE